MNKAVLLQVQQASQAKARKELEMRNDMKQVYDNVSYEDNEMKQDADRPPTDTSEPSQMKENQQKEKEVRIDSF